MISVFSIGSMEKALCRLFRHCLGHMENCLVLYFHLNWSPDEFGKPGHRTDARWDDKMESFDQFLQSLNSLPHTFYPSRYFSEFFFQILSLACHKCGICDIMWRYFQSRDEKNGKTEFLILEVLSFRACESNNCRSELLSKTFNLLKIFKIQLQSSWLPFLRLVLSPTADINFFG